MPDRRLNRLTSVLGPARNLVWPMMVGSLEVCY